MGGKSFRIWFNKIDGFIKIDNAVRYLLEYNEIYNRIKYLISKKGVLQIFFNHTFARIRIDSCNSLPIEKIMTFQNVIILNKSAVNENKNHYYNILLENSLYK